MAAVSTAVRKAEGCGASGRHAPANPAVQTSARRSGSRRTFCPVRSVPPASHGEPFARCGLRRHGEEVDRRLLGMAPHGSGSGLHLSERVLHEWRCGGTSGEAR